MILCLPVFPMTLAVRFLNGRRRVGLVAELPVDTENFT